MNTAANHTEEPVGEQSVPITIDSAAEQKSEVASPEAEEAPVKEPELPVHTANVDSDVDSDDEDESDEKPAPKRRCGGRISNRCFWVLISLGIIVALLAIIIPVLVVTVGKDFAQHLINETKVNFVKVEMYQPTSDSVMSKAWVTVKDSGPLKTKVKATTCNLKDFKTKKQFGTMATPEYEVGGSSTLHIILDAKIAISDQEMFNSYSKTLMSNHDVDWYMECPSIDIEASVLFIPIKYNGLHMNKEIIMHGTKLENMEAVNVRIIKADNSSMTTKIDQSLNNAGSIEMSQMGTAHFDLFINGTTVGKAVVDNFGVGFGQTTIKDIEATISITDDNKDIIKQFTLDFINYVPIPMTMNGPTYLSTGADYLLNTVSSDVVMAPSYEDTCGSTVIDNALGQTGIDIVQNIFDESSISYGAMGMYDAKEDSIMAKAHITLETTVKRKNLVNGVVPVYANGDFVAHMGLENLWVGNATINKTVIDSPMTDINATTFSRESAKMLTGGNVHWTTGGKLGVVACMGGATMRYQVNMNKPVDIAGSKLHDFVAVNPIATAATDKTMTTEVSQQMMNDGTLTLNGAGDATMDLFRGGAKVGEVLIKNFTLTTGLNTINATTTIIVTDDNQKQVKDFVNDFINKKNITGLSVAGPKKLSTGATYLYNTLSVPVAFPASTSEECGTLTFDGALGAVGLSVAQDIFENSELVFGAMALSNPQEFSIDSAVDMTVHNSGPRTVTLKEAAVTVYNNDGEKMAVMNMPSINVGTPDFAKYNGTVVFKGLKAPLTNIIADPFRKASSGLLNGVNGKWNTSGNLPVRTCMAGAAFTYTLNFDKVLGIQSSLLKDAAADNVVTVAADDTSLTSTCTQTLTNAGQMSVDLQSAHFDMEMECGGKDIKIADVWIKNFNLTPGTQNYIVDSAKVQVADGNGDCIKNFLLKFIKMETIPLKVSGPTKLDNFNAPYLLHTTTLTASMLPQKDQSCGDKTYSNALGAVGKDAAQTLLDESNMVYTNINMHTPQEHSVGMNAKIDVSNVGIYMIIMNTTANHTEEPIGEKTIPINIDSDADQKSVDGRRDSEEAVAKEGEVPVHTANVDGPDSDDESETDEKPAPKRRCGGRISNRCFWVLISIGVIIALLAIIIPVLVVTVGKDFAQHLMDDAKMNFDTVQMSAPEGNSVMTKAWITVKDSGPFKTKIKPTTCKLKDYATKAQFATMETPEMKVGGSSTLHIVLDAKITISDFDKFNAYTQTLMTGKDVDWYMECDDVSIEADILFIPIKYSGMHLDKEMIMHGTKLQNMEAVDVRIMSATNTSMTTKINQNLYNPGSITLSNMGEAHFDLFINKTRVGKAVVDNFSVGSGNTSIKDVVATIGITDENKGIIKQFTLDFINYVPIPMTMKGPTYLSSNATFLLNTVSSDVVMAPSYEDTCGSTVIDNALGQTGIDIVQSIFDESSISYGAMGMYDAREDSIMAKAHITLETNVKRKNLVNGVVPVYANGDFVAHMGLENLWVGNATVNKTVIDSPMTDINATAFARESAKMLNGGNADWTTGGKLGVVACMGGATMKYQVNMNKPVKIAGSKLHDFVAVNPIATAATDKTMTTEVDQHMMNDGTLTLNGAGDATMDLFRDGAKVGEVLIKDFTLTTGLNNIKALTTIIVTDDNQKQVKNFVSDFINKKDISGLSVKGPTKLSTGATDFFSHNMVGDDFVVQLVGPISTAPVKFNYFNNAISFDVRIKGQKITDDVRAGSYSMNSLVGPPSQLLLNPLAIPVKGDKFDFQMQGDTYVGWRTRLFPNLFAKVCPDMVNRYADVVNGNQPRSGEKFTYINSYDKNGQLDGLVPNPSNLTMAGVINPFHWSEGDNFCTTMAVTVLCAWKYHSNDLHTPVMVNTKGQFLTYFGCKSLPTNASKAQASKCFENAFTTITMYHQNNIPLSCVGRPIPSWLIDPLIMKKICVSKSPGKCT
eukprot:Nk52_evm81s212 gene=Nk52_evmTU81s212